MAHEEVQEEQGKNEAANAEDDMDSLMDELEDCLLYTSPSPRDRG